MKRYFCLLDPLRFLAAFWVMNFHYLLSSDSNPDLHWYRFGNLGVQIFFIISGFVIVQSLKGKTLRQFALGRFVRLFPIFWVLCTITFLLTLLFPDVRFALHFTDYLRSMTMLGDVFINIAGPANLIDPSYWTLTVELLFYVMIGLFVYFTSYKKIRYFLAAWLLVSAVAFLFHIDQIFYVKLLLVRHASYFVFGGALALIAARDATRPSEAFLDRALLLLSAAYAIYIHPSALPAYGITNPLDSGIVTAIHVAIFIVIPISVYLSTYIQNARVIQWLGITGALTYPLYLLHQKIGNIFIGIVASTGIFSWHSSVILFEFIIIGLAYLVSQWDAKFRSFILKPAEKGTGHDALQSK